MDEQNISESGALSVYESTETGKTAEEVGTIAWSRKIDDDDGDDDSDGGEMMTKASIRYKLELDHGDSKKSSMTRHSVRVYLFSAGFR